MKILTASPIDFTAGDILTPEDLNEVYFYAQDALTDVASRRFVKSPLVLPFCESCATPYTQAMATEELTYRFTCPVTCVVERGYLNANMTSNAEVKWNITTSAGATPTGCTVPWLTTGAAVASAAVDTADLNVDRFTLVAGTEYKITVSSSGNFTLNRADITLHLATDRWVPAGSLALPSFSPTPFTDASLRDANTVAANNAALATQAAALATHKSAAAPVLFVRHGLLSGTSANVRTFSLPQLDSARAQCKIVGLYLYSLATGAATVAATVKSNTGLAVATATCVHGGAGFLSASGGALSQALDNGASDTPSKDFTLAFSNTSGVNTATKVYALVWLSRA